MRILSVFLYLACFSLQAADISLMGGYGFGGDVEDVDTEQSYSVQSSPVVQATIDFSLGEEENRKRETYENLVGAFFSWQQTDIDSSVEVPLDIGYAHLTATRRWNYPSFQTYATAGAGLTHIATDSSIGRFSISIGGGYLYHLTDHLDLKLEGRVYNTFFSDSSQLTCGGGCTLGFSGSLWSQANVSAGLNFRF